MEEELRKAKAFQKEQERENQELNLGLRLKNLFFLFNVFGKSLEESQW